MSQLFGYQILPEDKGQERLTFPGAQLVGPSTPGGAQPQLRLFATSPHSLRTAVVEEREACVYLWGTPTHPRVSRAHILTWCADVVAEQSYARFKELLGNFALVVDEPRRGRITFVTDVLGIRPLFTGRQDGRLVFGSDVWRVQEAGLIRGTIDYTAVSSWIAYQYNCTNSSLFTELRRLPPGAALVCQDGQCVEVPYAEFSARSSSVPPAQIVEEVHGLVSSAVQALLADTPRACIALSGGYDSRYLLALAASQKDSESLSVTTVATDEEERRIAGEVAGRLNVPVRELSVETSVWDLYDSVYHFTADGFPISKFVTYCIAQQDPHLPMINGFMGDSLVRGSKDRFLGKYETEWNENLIDVLQRKYLAASFDLFRPESGKHILERSRVPMERAVTEGSRLGKVFGWADFYYRQRFYISNNFLQHLDFSEALLPFYTWPLLAYKLEHDYGQFDATVYREIFRRFFPALADIPHADDRGPRPPVSTRSARWTRRWAWQLLPVLLRRGWLSFLSKRRCVLLTSAGAVGDLRAESTVFALERFYLLEERVRAAHLEFDWETI